jgi:hypothetical protein
MHDHCGAIMISRFLTGSAEQMAMLQVSDGKIPRRGNRGSTPGATGWIGHGDFDLTRFDERPEDRVHRHGQS